LAADTDHGWNEVPHRIRCGCALGDPWESLFGPLRPCHAREAVRQNKLWDGHVVNLQIVDNNERATQLRALVSARTSPEVWDLRCEVREKLIIFLQERFPGALPKQRPELVDLADRRSAGAAL
jgi:hypothetical protein